MREVSQAAALLRAAAAPSRLTILATVATRQARGDDCSVIALAADLDLPVRSVLKEAVRLQECGLMSFHGQSVSVDLATLSDTADALVAGLPVTRLLDGEPDLARFFTNGRLSTYPEDLATRTRVARLLVQLLPADRSLTEPEVNETLHQVDDDHATLRRLMVDAGLLTRNGSSESRRIDVEERQRNRVSG